MFFWRLINLNERRKRNKVDYYLVHNNDLFGDYSRGPYNGVEVRELNAAYPYCNMITGKQLKKVWERSRDVENNKIPRDEIPDR